MSTVASIERACGSSPPIIAGVTFFQIRHDVGEMMIRHESAIVICFALSFGCGSSLENLYGLDNRHVLTWLAASTSPVVLSMFLSQSSSVHRNILALISD